MRLTPLAKAFIAVVVVAVIGFATWHYKGDAIKNWAGGEKASGEDSKGDFDKLNNAPGDPNEGNNTANCAATHLGRRQRRVDLAGGAVAGPGDEPGELLVGDLGPIHPETVDSDFSDRLRVRWPGAGRHAAYRTLEHPELLELIGSRASRRRDLASNDVPVS